MIRPACFIAASIFSAVCCSTVTSGERNTFSILPSRESAYFAPDTPGFYFLDTGPSHVETSGPVVTASGRALVPVAMGVEIMIDFSVGLAYFPYAPQLSTPQPALEPLSSLTVGAGF